MKPLIVFNAKQCISCHSCEVACQMENDCPPGLQLRWVKSHTSGEFPTSEVNTISTACFHCNDAACVSACPAGALLRRADGVVEHVRNRCIGCGYCILACPFHVPKRSPTQNTMRKCSFCIQRIDRGKPPACAAKCTTGALTYFADGTNAGASAYGKLSGLHMVYEIEGKPEDFSLPVPVPLNTVTSLQSWKWLAGLLPGGLLLAWLWKRVEALESDDE